MNKNNLQQAIREFLSKDKSSLVIEETLTRAQLDKREDYLKDLKKQNKNLIKRYGKDAEAVMYGRATNLAKKAVSEMDKQKLKELVKTSLMTDEVEENKVYGPGELDFSSVVTQEQRIVAKAFMIDPTRTKFDYKNNAVTFPDPIQVELSDGSTAMLGSVKMGNQLGFVKGYFDEDGNEIQGASIKMPYKNPMGEGKKEDVSGPEGKPDGKIDSKDYLAKRDAAIKKAKGEVKEDMDLGHEDNEPHMLKGDLYRIGKYAMELYQMVDQFEGQGEVDFPAWWQAMITDAASKMVKAKHYLDFELKEPSVDAALGVATDNTPMMEDKGDKHAVMKDGKYYTGTEFVSDIKDAMRYNLDSATMVAKREKGMVYTPKKMNENSAEETLAAKIAKALKNPENKSPEDQNNIKQARKAMNKGDIKAAEKIVKPYN
jgi:hypothetical protein